MAFKKGHKPWNTGKRKGYIKGGYLNTYCPEHPLCNVSGFVPEHRLVMEKHIGRFLTKEEVVHHKDGNKLNNIIGNLEILTNSKHVTLHKTIHGLSKTKEYRKQINERNKPKRPLHQAKYYSENREAILLRKKKYREEHREEINLRRRKSYAQR